MRKNNENGNGILTKRETEVLTLLCTGMTYKEVADELFISTETVRTHAHRIYQRMGVKNKTQAALKFNGNLKSFL